MSLGSRQRKAVGTDHCNASWPAPRTQSGALLQAGHGGSIWQNAAQNVTFYNNMISSGLAINGSGGLEMLSTNLTAFDSNTFINNVGTQGAGALCWPMCLLFASRARGTARLRPDHCPDSAWDGGCNAAVYGQLSASAPSSSPAS